MGFKISGDQGVGPVGGIKSPRKAETSRAEGKKMEDKVAFSSVLQEANRVRQAQPAADSERAEKIQALKEQIADGSYRPDLTKVAASLLKFIAEGKKCMAAPSLREQLQRLLSAILRERECAKALDMEALLSAAGEKEALLALIAPDDDMDAEERILAETVRVENRRNAYLFWATLTWVRESMQFFGRQVSAVSYGAHGRALCQQHGGKLLSGKV